MADAIDPRWAWEPYRPSGKDPWDLKKVGHLHRRAAFGATWAELQAGLAAGPEKAVEDLLKGHPGLDRFEQETADRVASIARANTGAQAKAWWLYRVLYDPDEIDAKKA